MTKRKWPSIVQVVDALNRGADRFIASFEDVIVSLPSEANRVTSSNRTCDRLQEGKTSCAFDQKNREALAIFPQ